MRSLWYFLVSLYFAHGLPDLNIGGVDLPDLNVGGVDLPDIVANAVNGAESIFGNVAGNAADSALEKLADELMAQLNAINQSPSKDAAAGCLQTEVEIGGVCVAKKNLGQSCPKGVKQCPSGAICSRLCVCPSGYLGSGPTLCVKCNPSTQVLVDGKCYSMATFNAACVVREQCSFAGGVCTGTAATTCQCMAGNVWDGKACAPCGAGKVIVNNACLELSTFGAACKANQQCTSYAGGVCTAGKCACSAGTAWNLMNACAACSSDQVLVAGQCLDKVRNGAVCTHNDQCSYTGGACVKNVCACSGTLAFTGTQCAACTGVMQNNMCYPYAARGQVCVSTAQCTKTAGTQCISFVCQCPTGTIFNDVSCVKK